MVHVAFIIEQHHVIASENHVTLKFDFIKLYSFYYLVLKLLSQNQCYDQRGLTQTQIGIMQSISLLDGWLNGSWVLPAGAIVET